MAHCLLLLFLASGLEMQVDWRDLTIHFYGPVDLAADSAYQSELEVNFRSCLAEIPLDAERTLGEAVVRSRDAENYYRTVLSYPQVVSTRYSTSGEIQNEYSIRLLGPFIEEILPPPARSLYYQAKQPDTSTVLEEELPCIPVTGFIIDARGTGFMPGIFPRLVDEQGNIIFDAGMVNRDVLLERGYIRYAYSPSEALQTRELGLNPLRVVAERAVGKNRCDLVLSSADMDQITSSPLNLRLLEEARVIIIIDREQ